MADVSELELIRSIADDLPVGVWVARAPGGELLYANRTFGEIMGTSARGDVAAGEYAAPYGIYGTDGALYPEEKMPFVVALRAREMVVVDDIVIHRRDGTRAPVRAHARPIIDDAGEITHVAIVFFDITKEVEARRAGEELGARLRQAERMQSIGQLASGIAHDFNNVLAVVRVLATRLALGETDPTRADLFTQLDAAAESGAGLAQQLLLLGGQGRSTTAPVALDALASSVSAVLARTLDGRIDVRFESDGTPVVVRGDPSRLEQVIMNLAINARDALGGSGGSLTIRVRATALDAAAASRLQPLAAGDHAVLEVSDTGPGIPRAIRDRVFEPYFTTRTTGEHRGSGLGLATVYGIVEAHRGAIEIADVVPHGTTMRVWLPADASLAAERWSARPPEPAIDPDERRHGTILFVDDEDALRRSCRAALTALGYDVIVASGGDEAVRIARARHAEIDAVLLDLVMPGIDGEETYEALRAIDASLPVVLTTATPFDPAVPRMLEHGVRELLPKPYGVSDVTRAIERIRRPTP